MLSNLPKVRQASGEQSWDSSQVWPQSLWFSQYCQPVSCGRKSRGPRLKQILWLGLRVLFELWGEPRIPERWSEKAPEGGRGATMKRFGGEFSWEEDRQCKGPEAGGSSECLGTAGQLVLLSSMSKGPVKGKK